MKSFINKIENKFIGAEKKKLNVDLLSLKLMSCTIYFIIAYIRIEMH